MCGICTDTTHVYIYFATKLLINLAVNCASFIIQLINGNYKLDALLIDLDMLNFVQIIYCMPSEFIHQNFVLYDTVVSVNFLLSFLNCAGVGLCDFTVLW